PDRVEISSRQHSELLDAQAAGKRIAADANGYPVAVDPPPPTTEEIKASKVVLVQAHMDSAAQAMNYDSIANAITYAEEPAVPKFQAEGLAFRAWRSHVWARCYAILAEFESGARGIPSDDELIAALPELQLPQ
ncbi:MAG: hypothetical protein ACN6P8_01220, partial [Achromobacter piechaudii]